MAKDVFSYIKEEEQSYKTRKVTLADGYDWNMAEHIRKTILYLNSQYTTGANDGSRPFKNILKRIINLQHLATGFDVKDIEPFIDNAEKNYKSFLVRKYHPKWARKHDLDTFIDDTVESYVDFGLTLTKHANKIAPECIPLQSIAFCDQTDILYGPICLKHQYSPDQLKDMEGKGWKNVEKVIQEAKQQKTDSNGQFTQTPGKFIEVYELDGVFPEDWMTDTPKEYSEESKFTRQFHLITFYKDKEGNKQGLRLFAGKGDPEKYKALKRDKFAAFGRACGIGGVEENFDAQIWLNYDMIRIQGMLDAASKVLHVTSDPGFATRNNVKGADNNEVFTIADGKEIHQLNTQPVNLVAFENAAQKWEEHAQGIGSAYDAVLGEKPSAGTPFKLQEAVINQGQSPHEYRKGKVATYLGEIYRDWILQDLVKEMNNEQEFSEELTMSELQYVGDALVTHETNKMIVGTILSGTVVTPEMIDQHKQMVLEQFNKKGSKHFFKLLKNELKDLPIDVDINIAGKQRALEKMTDKLSNIFRQIIANPQGFAQAMQMKGVPDIFNEMLESSGINQINFAGLKAPPLPPQQPQQGTSLQAQPLPA